MIVSLALLCAAPAPAVAQAADPAAIAAQRAAMAKLNAMDGAWRGPATIQTPQGERKLTQTERIGGFLDGTLKLVEGHGFEADGTPSFHAFAVISYDPASKRYTMTSYAQGRAGQFPLTPTDTGYVWEIPAGPSTIRYTATIGEKSYREVGDYVAEGQPPRRFFEMELARIGDTDWPEAGALRPE